MWKLLGELLEKLALELEAELATVRELREALAAKTPEDLWLTDLDIFSEAYEVFAAARLAARSQVGPAVKKLVKAAPKKK